VRLARVLAADLGGERRDGGVAASRTGTGGSIVFVLAASVRAPLPGLAISNGLFPGLAGVVKTLADERGPSGIRINGLLPVRIATGRVRQLDALLGEPDEVRARLSQSIPLRRYGEPAEFGHVAAFVLSPAASYITGAMILTTAVPSAPSERPPLPAADRSQLRRGRSSKRCARSLALAAAVAG
jgi:3-oxoacyl-[acyl-carrier protein] reductase